MLAKQEKKLFQKITRAVGIMLEKIGETWTDREISEATKIQTNRLTEYKNYDKYQRAITVNNFSKLLGGGFFTVDEIIKLTDNLTEDEKRHLTEMDFYGSKAFRQEVVKSKRKGVNPVELHSLVNKLIENGIDAMEILRKAEKDL